MDRNILADVLIFNAKAYLIGFMTLCLDRIINEIGGE